MNTAADCPPVPGLAPTAPAALPEPAHHAAPGHDTGADAAAWRAALDAAIAADPRGKLGVALALGVSRPYVSRVATGHIAVASPLFIQRVIDTYLQVDCPHLQRTLPPGQCRAYAQRLYADISREDVAHWRACRRCPHNPDRAAARPAAGADTAAAAEDAS